MTAGPCGGEILRRTEREDPRAPYCRVRSSIPLSSDETSEALVRIGAYLNCFNRRKTEGL